MCDLQITSLFMHISPALVCWAWRWYPDPSVVKFDKMSAEQLKAYNTASWWDIGVLSMSSYMVWVVLYYLKVSLNTYLNCECKKLADLMCDLVSLNPDAASCWLASKLCLTCIVPFWQSV